MKDYDDTDNSTDPHTCKIQSNVEVVKDANKYIVQMFWFFPQITKKLPPIPT